MKRFLVALLMAAMTVTAVTGCGSKGGDSAKSDSPSGAAADAERCPEPTGAQAGDGKER